MEFIAELQVSSDRRTWRGDEAIELTASALHPVPDSEPGLVAETVKVDSESHPTGCSELTAPDWQTLHEAWTKAGLAKPEGQMTEAQWMPYVLAFNESKDRPAWELGIVPPLDPHMVERLSQAAAREEHAAILKRAIESGAVVAINPLTGARADSLSRLEMVALRRDGLAQFCTMVSIRLVASEPVNEPELPRFAIPVRPVAVPNALRALNPDQSVRYGHGASCGITGSGIVTAADLVAQFEGVLARQHLGAFTPDEAAHLVAEAQGFDSKSFRQRLEDAFRAGALIVRAPDTELPRKPSEPWRPHSDIVMVADLNAWLTEQRVSYRFPDSAPPAVLVASATPQGPTETSQQRCARLLRELRTEEAKQQRGALARVVKRDGRARQTVSEDIAKARELEAADAGPLAAMTRIVCR